MKKGEISVENIFRSLEDYFVDDSFENVSEKGKFTDILATTFGSNTPVLIEIKDYKTTIPSKEVQKFWRDMEIRGARYGIFISMRSGITKCSGALSIKTEMDKTGIFVVNCDLNWVGHRFAYYVIKKMTELETVKKADLKGDELSNIITRINSHITDLQKHVDSIEKLQSIADNLKSTCNNRLDELINLSNIYQRTLNEKISDVMHEIEKSYS
jgi:hypothetical protein